MQEHTSHSPRMLRAEIFLRISPETFMRPKLLVFNEPRLKAASNQVTITPRRCNNCC